MRLCDEINSFLFLDQVFFLVFYCIWLERNYCLVDLVNLNVYDTSMSRSP